MTGFSAVEAALRDRADLDQYGSNKRLLFALQLDYEIEDIDAVAQDALTDGGDDKACDLVYVDRDRGEVVVAQSYEATSNSDQRWAPESKAAGLHQAVSWLLAAPFDTLPERLRDATVEVRDALQDGTVGTVRLWFVHNCLEGGNAVRELDQAVQSAKSHLTSHFDAVAEDIDVRATEVGPRLLASWYEGAQTPILVSLSHKPPLAG